MIQIRRNEERGHANHGWLDTHHTFSFADYYDPKFMGFRSLRVINEDRVAPGAGFGMHGHRDMEILTYVLKGSIAHKDSLGHQQVLGPNEIHGVIGEHYCAFFILRDVGTRRVPEATFHRDHGSYLCHEGHRLFICVGGHTFEAQASVTARQIARGPVALMEIIEAPDNVHCPRLIPRRWNHEGLIRRQAH